MTPTPEQRAIIDAPDLGELYVIAGPGAGKTAVIAQRTARLIADGVREVGQIAAITYTTAMARRLADAIRDALPESIACSSCGGSGTFKGTDLACGMCADGRVEPAPPFVGTMHALAAWATGRALRGEITGRAEIMALGWLPHGAETFGIALPEDVDDMVDAARRAPGRKITKKALRAGMGATGRDLAGWPAETRARQELARRGLLTYGDLLTCLSVIVGAQPSADVPSITDEIGCLLLDEAQDFTGEHWSIVDRWGADFTAVGDDGQEIFGFLDRDGDGSVPTFRERVAMPGANVMRLGRSFRSGPALVDPTSRLRGVLAADGVCSALPMVSAIDDHPRGIGLQVTRADEGDEGGIYSAARAVDSLMFMGYEPHEIAVIARRWAEVETLACVLEEQGIGVTMPHRSRDVWRSLAGRAFVAMVRHASTGFLDEHGAEVILRALGIMAPARVAERAAHAALARGESLAEALDRDRDALQGAAQPWWSCCGLLDSMADFESHLADNDLPGARLIERAWRSAVEPFSSVERAMMKPADWLLWLAGPDAQSGEATFEQGKVALTSVHGAKGLEWPAVVVMGACAGHWPGHMDKGESGEAEAARALYVSMTRARETCRVIAPALLRGKPRDPSPWLVAAGMV
jgi:DNA helicase-2/ATP-dependent DNA helicase PcrA